MTERRKAYTDAKRWAENFDRITELRKSGLMWKEIAAQHPQVTASNYMRYARYHGLDAAHIPRREHWRVREDYVARHRRMEVARGHGCDWEGIAERFGFSSWRVAYKQFHYFAKRLAVT